MADKKKQRPATRFSPKGIAHFPWLNSADYTKWVNGVKDGEDRTKGKYKTGLILEKSNPEHKKFLDWLEGAFADAVKQGYQEMVEKAGEVNVKKKYPNLFDKSGDFKEASKPWKDDLEDDNKVIVSFSMNAQYEDKKTKELKPLEPQLWTANVKPWPRNIIIGGGSEIIVSFVPNPFVMAGVGAGLSLQIEGVQVITVKSFGKKTAEQSGFSAQAGGSEPDASEGQDTGGFQTNGEGDEPPPHGDEDAPPSGGKREF